LIGLIAALAICSLLRAADTDRLIGTWKLVSWQVVVENEAPREEFGQHPKGYLILTREGRSMVITTAEHRQPGMEDSRRAALQKSMVAYTGKYRVEGGDFITLVDVSWNEAWDGTEQRRHFRIEGDKLLIETAPGPSILDPGKSEIRRIIWQRQR
jgi:hypothetical protein